MHVRQKYIVGSGWWCNERENDGREKFLGDETIRKKEFHSLWYESVDKFTSPQKMILVDSNSPIKPPLNKSDSRLEFISLNINAKHSTNHIGRFCGYTRAIIVALSYAEMCECDYFVYVEQDALLFGENIVEYCISKMTSPVAFGEAKTCPGKLQQSFFIIKKDFINTFLKRLKAIPYRDFELSPEEQFSIAASTGSVKLLSFVAIMKKRFKVFEKLDWHLTKYFSLWTALPIGYGRNRPINFEDDFFYFQHGDEKELKKYKLLTEEV